MIKNHFFLIRKYPLTIQLPITYLCNCDCVMCGMHHMISRKDFSANELKAILSDKLFSHVRGIGINGGEPFLKEDLVECCEAMLDVLSDLNEFNIISNGFFTEKILSKLAQIKEIAAGRNVKVNLSISVDGINDMQDLHRGRKNAFINADKTIRSILSCKDKYVDSLNVICTITKINISRINEVEAWAESLGIEVSYNIATVNVRIENENRLENFSVFSDEHSRMLAQEFFYTKYRTTGIEKYFGLYLFLKTGKRYADCPCMFNEWITLTPDTQIGFCATHSKNLGSALQESPYEIVQNNISYLKEIKKTYCNSCSHYMYSLNTEGLKLLYDEKMREIF